jgi:hypothetical protein
LRALALPGLHPIAKAPFPEGVEQATLCAALDSKEADLWLRFGHFIPLFERGVLYVLNTGPELNDELRDYMAREYKPGWNAMLGSCGERTLVYIRVMYGDGEYDGKPFGRMHLAQQLEKRFGLKVLENIQIGEDDRFPRYCRADAELCDAILKLHVGNKGLGLCAYATSRCGAEAESNQETLRPACEKVPRPVLACSEYARASAESAACTDRIRAALCP